MAEFVFGLAPLRQFQNPPPVDVVTPIIDLFTSPFRAGDANPNSGAASSALSAAAGAIAPRAEQLAAQAAAQAAANNPAPVVLPMWSADP